MTLASTGRDSLSVPRKLTVYQPKAAGAVKHTPRGILGGCYKCGALRMRLCACHENKEREINIGKQCDLFSKSRNGMMSDGTGNFWAARGSSFASGSGRVTPNSSAIHNGLKQKGDLAASPPRPSSSMGISQKALPSRKPTPDLNNIEDALHSLKQWYEKGFLNESEYIAEKAKALSGMALSENVVHDKGNVPPSAFSTSYTSAFGGRGATKQQGSILTKYGFGPGGQNVSASIIPSKDVLNRADGSRILPLAKPAELSKLIIENNRKDAEGNHSQYALSPRSSIHDNSLVHNGIEWENDEQIISKDRVDFLMAQLRMMCYRKVKGCGADVSIREIFRHFDSDKDDGQNGIAESEWIAAVTKLMLGCAGQGLISVEEAKCLFRRMDYDGNGTIDYRETAEQLSLPGWDHRYVGKKSNVLL